MPMNINKSHDFLGPEWGFAVTHQAERVVRHLIGEGRAAGARPSRELIKGVLLHHKCLPPALLKHVFALMPDASRSTRLNAAVALAVCAFPRRLNSDPKSGVETRLAHLLKKREAITRIVDPNVDMLAADESLIDLVRDRFEGTGLEDDQILRLMIDMCAADLEDLSRDPRQLDSSFARTRNSALFLCTCSPQMVETIARNWRRDAGLVRLYREWFMSPPSTMPSNWLEHAPYASSEHGRIRELTDWLQIFERKGHSIMRALPGVSSDRVQDLLADEWLRLYLRLRDGFPSHMFGATFYGWFLTCIGRKGDKMSKYIKLVTDEELAGLSANSESLDPGVYEVLGKNFRMSVESLFGPDDARLLAEHFKIVQATLFPRNVKSRLLRYRTYLLREAAAEVWEAWINGHGDSRTMSTSLDTIAAAFPGCRVGYLSGLRTRCRYGVWAGNLSRDGEHDDAWIERVQVPRWAHSGGRARSPLAGLSDMRLVTAFTRLAAPGETALWPYLALRTLYPIAVNRPQVDCNWPELVRELRWWVNSLDALDLVRVNMSRNRYGHRINLKVLAALERGPLRELVDAFKDAADDDALLAKLACSGLLRRSKAAAQGLLSGLLAPWTLADVKAVVAKLARRPAARRWVVPVLYLTILERREPEEIHDRLHVPPEEHRLVNSICSEIQTCRSLKTKERAQ